MREVVGPAGVAAVDDDVTLGEQLAERRRRSAGSARRQATITQTTRGEGSASTIASMLSTSLTSGFRS